MQTQRIAATVDTVYAITGANTGSDRIVVASQVFVDEVKVCDMRTGHTYQVDVSLGNRIVGRRQVRHAGRV